jgi:hypothetical protein
LTTFGPLRWRTMIRKCFAAPCGNKPSGFEEWGRGYFGTPSAMKSVVFDAFWRIGASFW